ncbi:hypothetical protein BDY24DRAFT_383043 [Mrakia frigida]|uniref:uncharacterized protein n=1 Tax=Mrakia frigida TaxID=29902 RepID=UPI003FCC0B3A
MHTLQRCLLALLPLLFLTPSLVVSLGQKSIVAFESAGDSFPLVSSGRAVSILVSKDDFPGILRAAKTFAGDIKNVTSQAPDVLIDLASNSSLAVVLGSVGSPFVSTLVNAGAMNVSDIQGRWEAFKIQIVDGSSIGVERALVIAGSDKRGTIYGIYDLAEQIGVSPWFWWSDVRIPHRDELYIKNDIYVHASPSVKYRGFFLNDEQPSLTNWAVERYNTNISAPFQHEFYEAVFELILRLRANMFWPAMWSAKFAVDDPLNQFLADDYGVIYSTSHQEPMARNTPEWGAYGNGVWNYTINKPFLNNFWTEGIERAKPFETIVTVGMRGDGDLPLPGANIQIIQDIIVDQREIISNVTGNNASEVPQIWCLYKEVQGYWDSPAGETKLEAADDITLLWTDDNWGNIRRVPTAGENQRSGGAGMYYHFDYVGDPRNYKWLNTNNIAKVYEQLSLALEFGADRLWVVNVGDLRPMEMPMNFYFELAYDATRWNKDNLDEYLLLWAAREYGSEVAEKTASVFSRYMKLVSRQKPELNSPTTYSLISFREADLVVAEWEQLVADALEIYQSLDETTQSSFFQTVLHPVRAVATVILLNVAVGENNLRAVQARMSTISKAEEAISLFSEDAELTREFHAVNGGKWNHMMDQPHLGQWGWQQNMVNTLPAINYVQPTESTLPGPLRVSVQGSLGVWPGDALNQCAQGYNCPPPVLPLLTPYSEPSRYFDISTGANIDWSWTASANESFVQLSKTSGEVQAADSSTWESRVEVSVPDWSLVPSGRLSVSIRIRTTSADPTTDGISPRAPMSYSFTIPIQSLSVPANYSGFVESDGGVSIEAAHSSRNTSVGGTSWEILPGYSPRTSTGEAVSLFPRVGSNFSVGAGPKLEYDFFIFNNQTRGNLTVNAYLGTSLNYQLGRPLKYAVQIDDLAPQVVQPVPNAANAGSNPPDWNGVVAASVRISSTNHTLTTGGPGAHTLSFWGIEPGVVLEKIVINTVAPSLVPKSYLGQPESKRVGV